MARPAFCGSQSTTTPGATERRRLTGVQITSRTMCGSKDFFVVTPPLALRELMVFTPEYINRQGQRLSYRCLKSTLTVGRATRAKTSRSEWVSMHRSRDALARYLYGVVQLV